MRSSNTQSFKRTPVECWGGPFDGHTVVPRFAGKYMKITDEVGVEYTYVFHFRWQGTLLLAVYKPISDRNPEGL